MIKKELLLGDEAIAWGALNAGLSGVYAYPGTPSTEITEFIQMHPLTRERGIHCNWSANEKTALEAALGMSFVGKRALVCMKHVGMNVCADAFVNSAMTGANGGLVVVAADDPSMHSSQNEQDSRFYAKFAMIPCFEPASQQEAYEMIGEAFDFSEKYQIPVLMRVTTRMAHSRAVVEIGEPRQQNTLHSPRAAPPVDPHAGQLARTLQNPHRGEQTLRAGGRTFAPQPLHRRTGQIHGHHRLRSGLQLYYGELPGRLPLPRAEDLAISAADGTRTAHGFGVPFAADRRRGTTSGGGDDPRSAGYSDSGQRTFERRAAPHGRTHARQRTRRPRSAPRESEAASQLTMPRPRRFARAAATATYIRH